MTAALIVALAAGCATAGTPTSTATPPPTATATLAVPAPATTAPVTDAAAESEFRAAFKTYNDSLLARDFATACASITESAVAAMSAKLVEAGGPAGASCEEIFTIVYRDRRAAQQLDAASKSITLGAVLVDRDAAVFVFTVAGVPPARGSAQRVDGHWRFDSANAD